MGEKAFIRGNDRIAKALGADPERRERVAAIRAEMEQTDRVWRGTHLQN